MALDASDWIAVIAVVVAVVSGGAAIKYARKSAVQAERSADHAGDAVIEARRAADEAAQMRAIETDRRADEKERWHHECEPVLPGEIDASVRGSGDTAALYGEITVARVYRVRAEAVSGASRIQLSLDMVTKPDQPIEFMIERRPQGKTTVDTEEIVFSFWPPVEGADGTGLWRCDCGRPGGGTMVGPGHWERRVKVSFRRPRLRSY